MRCRFNEASCVLLSYTVRSCIRSNEVNKTVTNSTYIVSPLACGRIKLKKCIFPGGTTRHLCQDKGATVHCCFKKIRIVLKKTGRTRIYFIYVHTKSIEIEACCICTLPWNNFLQFCSTVRNWQILNIWNKNQRLKIV